MKPTVLIVDDSRFSIELLAAFLGDSYEVCFAMSGEEAVEAAPDIAPDLILLDVVLPGIDGYVVCEHLRRHPELAHVPIIFSSGNHDAAALERGRAVGGDDFLAKPVKPAALRTMVQQYIDGAALSRSA